MTERTGTANTAGFILLREERFLVISLATCLIFFLFGSHLIARLGNPVVFGVVFVWLFGTILGSIFSVVRHADHVALQLGEPYGTLILTLAVTGIEVISICTIMFHGANNPTLARD